MDNTKLLLLLRILVLLGLIFSGYMTYEKFFESTCLEPCPIFLGYPACYFGFAGFSAMSTLLALNKPKRYVFNVASLGTLFAFYFAFEEMIHDNGLFGHRFYLSVCTIGWMIYACITIITYQIM